MEGATMEGECFTYRIDRRNRITSVAGDWHAFAEENAWDGGYGPDQVMGHPLWDFIQGSETRHLYETIFIRVRAGNCVGPIPFRCDSPGERRFLTLLLSPLPGGRIELLSTVIRRESRPPVKVFDRGTERSDEFVRVCSMCKKIATSGNEWVEIEEGIRRLRLFERDEMPGLTHGLCPDCFRVSMAGLK